MNSQAHQTVAPHLKRGIITIRLVTFIITLLFTKFGVFSTGLGLVTCANLIIETTLKLSFPGKYYSQNYHNVSMSYLPLIILKLDPCSLAYAQFMSYVQARNLVLEENRKNHRILFYILLLINWLIVILFKDSLFDECPHAISSILRKEAVIIFTGIAINHSAITKQIHVILSELKGTLSKVQDLNSKLEVVNKELQQSLDDKDNFILLFSHETRNPLNILIGNLTLLLGEVADIQFKAKLERCKFCADLLLQQLNNILDSGKLSSRGALELSPTPVRLCDYFRSISNFMEMLVKKKGKVKSELIIPEHLPMTLKFDMQRFTQVCLNLLTNSLKFTDSGTISLVVRYLRKDTLQESDFYPSSNYGHRLLSSSTKKEVISGSSNEIEEFVMETQIASRMQFTREIANLESKKKSFMGVDTPEKGFLKIEINDTGCGIKPEDLKKLFKKFSQTHSDAAQLKLGSGLGLWITKTLCEVMGGDVRAYSVPNVGSCFVAIIQADCLPSTRPRYSISSSQTLPHPTSSTEPGIKRILLVDDDPFNLEFHGHIIKSLGYDAIETAIDGQKLLEQFKARPEGYFDCVITDISMPHLDGIKAAQLVRKFEEEEKRSRRVKIGFITGHSNQRDQLICENEPLKCWFYLAKPIKPAIIEGFLPPLRTSSSTSLNKQEPVGYLDKMLPDNISGNQLVHYSPPKFSAGPLILCVDNDMFNLDFLEELVRSLGARPIKAVSGEESLEIIKSAISESVKEKLPKIILMDCRMPKMDGWTACKLIKEMVKKECGIEIPVIGVTGEDRHQNQEKFMLSGMEEILQKPIQKEDLQAILRKYA